MPEHQLGVRTCVGCGRKAPKEEFLRFVSREGVLVADSKAPGRGAYTCGRLACFERAATKNAFSRTLRRTVRIDQKLIPLLQEPVAR